MFKRTLRSGVLVALTLLVGVVLLLMAPPGQGASASDDRVAVLIAFDRAPGPPELALVEGVGGTVRHSYTLVPAIAASVPSAAIAGLERHPRVTRVEPDGRAYAIEHPVAGEPELNAGWGVAHIGSGDVHEAGQLAASVSVAIIDTGIDYTHPDLAANYAGGYNFITGTEDALDDNGHGTHVAGSACAVLNGWGVRGVAPACDLYGLKVLGADGGGSWSDILAAVEWSVHNGIDVVNLSLGAGSATTTAEAVFDAAYDAGVVIVAAAGNSGIWWPFFTDTVLFPARFDSVIAVAATDEGDVRASFSSTGPSVELAAPGVSILSTWHESGTVLCDDGGSLCGDYRAASGTSMASPHVAGVAALVVGAANGSLTNVEVRQILRDTAIDLGASGHDWLYGYGLVQAHEAVFAVAPGEPELVGTITGTVTDATTGAPIAGATVSLDTGESFTTGADGIFTAEEVPEGERTVTAAADGYLPWSDSVTVEEDGTHDVPIALEPEPAGMITGTVTDASTGNPIQGAAVTLSNGQSVNTSTGGLYSIDGVAPGEYTITASADGFLDADAQELAVGADGTVTPDPVDFALQPESAEPPPDSGTGTVSVSAIGYSTHGGRLSDRHLTVTLSLVDGNGDPVGGASVSLTVHRDGLLYASASGTTGNSGSLSLAYNNAPSGSYTTVVTDVTVEGLDWDGSTPANAFTK